MPLDALTTQRIRSLEVVLAWLIGRTVAFDSGVGETPPEFFDEAMAPAYMLELAEKIQEQLEEAEE